jgi:hypothetical protein
MTTLSSFTIISYVYSINNLEASVKQSEISLLFIFSLIQVMKVETKRRLHSNILEVGMIHGSFG